MSRHKLTLSPLLWPEDLRERFEAHPLTKAQRKRLRLALGRWLMICLDLGVDQREVSGDKWLQRTLGLPLPTRNDIRQALAITFPESAASLYEGQHERVERPDERIRLEATIIRNLKRFPEGWRTAAERLLNVGDEGFGDGILVQAWAPSTIKRRLEGAALYFDFCRANGLSVDITPEGVRARLRQEQIKVERGERRLGGILVELVALTGLATALRPERSWTWLKTARDRIKKLAGHHGSRNAARAVDAGEIRAAGQQLLQKADAAHAVARHRRDFVQAHTKARTALTMILLSEAPIRITSCADLELETSLLGDLAGLFLYAGSTKEGDSDRRVFSATLIDAIGRYIRLHRAVIAAPGETRLLVGERGGPIKGSQLSNCLGDFTKPVFRVRVTAHAVRHSVGNFIVGTAPDEAALAGVILNHKSDAITATYHQKADQIAASRRLGAATEQSAANLNAETSPTRRHLKAPQRRKIIRPVKALSNDRQCVSLSERPNFK